MKLLLQGTAWAMLAIVLVACHPRLVPVRIERHYTPETEYLTAVQMTSRRALLFADSAGGVEPVSQEYSQDLISTQRVRVGSVTGQSCPFELEMLDYRTREGERAEQVDLLGCVGVGSYDTTSRSLVWKSLKDPEWKPGSLVAESGWSVQQLHPMEAASYLAGSMSLLADALVDTTRILDPGGSWVESTRQEMSIGPWIVAWKEQRTVTLAAVRDGLAQLDVRIELAPEPMINGPLIQLEGTGEGKINFDLKQRFTAFNSLTTDMKVEITDSTGTWVANSRTETEIRTEARPWAMRKE